MAKSGTPEFNTLKECLEFLEWLGNGQGKKMLPQVAGELDKRLTDKYKNASKSYIASALFQLLSRVSKFYARLCKNPKRNDSKYNGKQVDQITEALLVCIPRFLAALYFLRYNVDDGFGAVGGGGWRDNWVAYYHTASVDQYLYAKVNDKQYGVIPGGFVKDEVKCGYYDARNGYERGKDMANDLYRILDKHSIPNNVFIDVFSTSVVPTTAGIQDSNTANALALVRSFCEIVGNGKYKDNGGELIQTLNQYFISADKRICWSNLKAHCKKLLEQFGNIFSSGRFSFTGYGREPGELNHTEFAKNTADWLRKNLTTVKNNVARIQAFDSKTIPFNSRLFRSSAILLPAHSQALGSYFTKNFFRYGFTFYSNDYKTQTTQYEDLFRNWNNVINDLKKDGDGGLDELKKILEGQQCPKENIENEDERSQNGVENQSPAVEVVPENKTDPDTETKTEPTKTEAAKPVVTKAEAAKPTDTRPQSVENNGDQTQGKKAEGAQNQGKKSEGDSSVSSPPSAQPQPSNVSLSSSQSSGDPAPSSGQDPGAQAASADSAQPSDKGTQDDRGGTTTASTGSDPGASGAGGRGGTAGKGDNNRNGQQECTGDFTKMGKYCVKNSDIEKSKRFHDIMNNVNQQLDELRRHDEFEGKKRQVQLKENIQTQILYKHPGRPKYPYVGPIIAAKQSRNTKGDSHALVNFIQPPPAVTVEGKALPNDTKPIAGKQWEDEKFKMLVRRGNILHGSAIKQPRNQSHTGRPWKHPKQSQPLPARSQRNYTSMTPSVMQGAPVVQIPQRTPKEIHKPPPVEVLDGHTFAFQQQLNGTDMTNTSITDEVVTLFENITPPLPPVLVSGNKITDPKLNAPLPPPPTLKARARKSNAPSKFAVTVPVNDEIIGKMLNVSGTDLTKPHEKDLNGCEYEGIDPPVPRSVFGGSTIPDPNLKSSPNPTAMFLPEPHPTLGMDVWRPYVLRDHPDFFDLQIEVPKLTLPDNDLDFDLDFDDDSTHIKDDNLPELISPSTHAISLDLPPPHIEQSLPPPEDFDERTIIKPKLTMCLAPWATSTPTPGSTNIPDTELFPAEAPRTVRDILTWLAGLKHEKHHDTLKQCIKRAFSGLHKDTSQLALSVNGSHILPQHVIDTIHLTAMFAGSVLNSIAPKWRENVSSKTVQPRSSDEPDCCALLCRLRDYVYACHHQLEFLKALCNRDKLSGGWQDCNYGSVITSPNSPLQAFLTDDWYSDFETHPFDPCNLCHKSRVGMGFKKNDLSRTSQLGGVISTILTPSCGGEGHDAAIDTK